MPVTVHRKGETVAVCLKGDIDHHTVPALREAIDDAVSATPGAKTLVLDFSDVTFMDSSGVGLVMGRCRLCRPRGIALRVVNLSPRDARIMAMSGVRSIAELGERSQT